MKQPATPTLEAMREIHPQSQVIGEFLEWLTTEKGIVLAKPHPRTCDLYMASYSIENLLAEFFKIDLKQAEKEKRALLDFVRHQNA